jgi:quinol monooxygenase YgiN
VMVITRFRVVDPKGFGDRVHAALTVLRARSGFLSADLERNLDEPDLWVLVTRWQNVGSYRRALQGYESKVVVVPLLSEALDEPSAYEDPALQ